MIDLNYVLRKLLHDEVVEDIEKIVKKRKKVVVGCECVIEKLRKCCDYMELYFCCSV